VSAALVIFAREPIPGLVKTRLAEVVGAGTATSVYTALLEHTVATARAAGIGAMISLAGEPGREWAETLDLPFEIQGGGDLGERMAECFRRRFAEGRSRVVIIGSDNAHLKPEHLRSAFTALDDLPVVVGPADDGGYWLIGQRAPRVDLFTDVPWSSPDTLEATRVRLRTLDIPWRELDTLPDIDTAEDLGKATTDPRIDETLRSRLNHLFSP
jgi:rSAM/selenodomain-associated transferase 1